MPAASPPMADHVSRRLDQLGAQVRARRRQHKISAATAAEAAGMSRVTLHRIERGEPSVTMGAYLSAMAALGLDFDVVADAPPGADNASTARPPTVLPARIRLDDYPQLRRLAWQRRGGELTPSEALNVYERNWRHVDTHSLEPHERALVDVLAATLGKGRLLV